ncbi:MFS transporter [Pseudomonas caspiana]|uniref:MFS transporter n=1 Tax=Pseudomonas caspiana TaxID=1451454 RepID=A0A1Y3P835_9PSED|nr:MFS transporter [Pseudomonas caspiana]
MGRTLSKGGRSRWSRVGVLIFISYFIAFADRSNIGVAAPQMAHDLDLSIRLVGALLSAFFCGYILTQIPGGWLAQRVGPVKVVAGAMILTGISACLTGLVTKYEALIAVRVLMGIAEGVIWPSFAVLFIRWFPGNERGRAVSVAQYALPMSSVFIAPLSGWMVDTMSWQHMFVLQGIPAIAIGVIFMLLVTDDPAFDKRIGEEERAYILKTRDQGTSNNARFVDVLKRPTVWLLGLASHCWIMGIFSFGLWMPSLIKQYTAHGYSTAGILTAIPFIFGAIAMYLNARFSDKTRHSKGWFVAIPITIAGLALFAQHYGPDTLGWALLTFSIAGAGLYSGAGTWWNWAISMFPKNQAGPAIGLMNIFASLGGIIGPFAVAILAEGGSPASSFYLLGYSLFIATGLILVLIKSNTTSDVARVHPAHQIN